MYAQMLSVSPSRMVIFDQWMGDSYSRSGGNNSLANLNDNKHKGVMSKAAVKRMGNAIDWLLCYSSDKKVFHKKTGRKFRFNIGFVTLTLSASQVHSDKVIKKTLLHQFLTEARWRWGVIHYVWKSERQKNGNIHFHIVTDKFIPYKELRDCWNRIQSKLGYVSRFCCAYGHSDPNSTDIHSVKNIKNVSAYIKKYMSKHADEEQIEGNIWGLSYSLSKSKNLVMHMDESTSKAFDYVCNMFPGIYKTLDYCGLLYVNVKSYLKQSSNKIVSAFLSHIQELKALFEHNQLSINCT